MTEIFHYALKRDAKKREIRSNENLITPSKGAEFSRKSISYCHLMMENLLNSIQICFKF